MFEYGKSGTKRRMRWTAPPYSTSTSPKSARASSGCHTRSTNASPGSTADSRPSLATARVTVDNDTSAPCSSRSHSHILVAV